MSRHSIAQGFVPPVWPDSSLPPQWRSGALRQSQAQAQAQAPQTNSIPAAYRPLPVPQGMSRTSNGSLIQAIPGVTVPPSDFNWNYGLGYDYPYEKPSRWGQWFAKKIEWDQPGYQYYGYAPKKVKYYKPPRPPKLPKSVITPSYGAPIPQVGPAPSNDTAIPDAPPPRLTPFAPKYPSNWAALSRSQQRAIKKEQKIERQNWEKIRTQQLKLWETAMKERRREEKVERKAEEKERKRKEKEMIWRLKHPEEVKRIPVPDTAAVEMGAPAAADAPEGKIPNDPLSFMLLPTKEEFGVRRPFNGASAPPALGGPGREGWPMMSRTMTHAIIDMSREERVHAINKGTLSVPNW